MGRYLVENILYFFTKIIYMLRIIFYFHSHFLYSIIFIFFFFFLFSILTFLFTNTNYNSKFNNISFFTIIDFL
jgi:hypothetical protein